MKKIYTLSVLLAGSIAGINAQKNQDLSKASAPGSSPIRVTEFQAIDLNPGTYSYSKKINPQTLGFSRRGNTNYNFIKIGSTKYDLQSNACMNNRIRLFPDGTIAATWTMSVAGADQFPDRGTGLNYYDGTNWGSVPSTKIETPNTIRTGWPSIGRLADGREFVIAHDVAGGFHFSKNASKGSSTWTTTKVLEKNPYKPIWGRAANNGDTIHFICSYSDSAASGDVRPRFNGIIAPLVYSRSMDGGVTWDKQHIMLPGYDNSRIGVGGGDQYSIDVRGSVVAIITGDLTEDVSMWKSTNSGNTWTKTILDTFDYAPYTSDKLMLDTPYTCDGTVDVAIDKDGNVHAFWGLGRVFNDDTLVAGYNFYPSTYGLMYWNEITKSSKLIATGGQFDRDDEPGLNIYSGTWQFLSSGSLPPKPQVLGGGTYGHCARLGNTSLLRQPSAAVTDNGEVYVTFSLPMERDSVQSSTGISYESNYRDICVAYSTDNGATWGNSQNLTQRIGKEDDFACVARSTNGFLHVMWQQDDIPGTNLQNNDKNASNHPVIENGNDIYYIAVPLTQIKNESIGNLNSAGIFDLNKDGEMMVVSQNQPNPFNGISSINVFMSNRSDVKLNITNLAGQVVRTQDLGTLSRGNHAIVIDGSQLPTGMYFYSIIAGKNKITRKMSVN